MNGGSVIPTQHHSKRGFKPLLIGITFLVDFSIFRKQPDLGAGAGQMSRVNSARLAGMLAKSYGGGGVVDTKGSVLASDAFFPFPDSLDWAVEAGASAVIEPGGSKKDQDVIERADELGLAMIFTGTRHFNH